MTKAQMSFYLDLDNIELLSEIRGLYHLKNLSQSIELIIRQWQSFKDEREKAHKLIKATPMKPSNPLVDL